MGKTASKRRESGRTERIYPDGMVVADSEVRRLIGKLRLRELYEACESFQLIREATFNPKGGWVDEWSLRLIKQVARETRRKCYHALLKAMLKAVKEGEKGVAAASLTAARVLELIVLHSRFDYISSEQVAGVIRDLMNARRIKPEHYNRSLRIVAGSSSPNASDGVERKRVGEPEGTNNGLETKNDE